MVFPIVPHSRIPNTLFSFLLLVVKCPVAIQLLQAKQLQLRVSSLPYNLFRFVLLCYVICTPFSSHREKKPAREFPNYISVEGNRGSINLLAVWWSSGRVRILAAIPLNILLQM